MASGGPGSPVITVTSLPRRCLRSREIRTTPSRGTPGSRLPPAAEVWPHTHAARRRPQPGHRLEGPRSLSYTGRLMRGSVRRARSAYLVVAALCQLLRMARIANKTGSELGLEGYTIGCYVGNNVPIGT